MWAAKFNETYLEDRVDSALFNCVTGETHGGLIWPQFVEEYFYFRFYSQPRPSWLDTSQNQDGRNGCARSWKNRWQNAPKTPLQDNV